MSEFIEGVAVGVTIGGLIGANVGILWAALCKASGREGEEHERDVSKHRVHPNDGADPIR